MDKLIDERNTKVQGMVWGGFLSVMVSSVAIAVVIFGILLGLDYLGYINFLTR